MANCDPACMKIIINSGLMAKAAELLANLVGETSSLWKSACDLCHASTALVETFTLLTDEDEVAATVFDSVDWKGCDEASEVMTMILERNAGNFDPAEAKRRLEELRDQQVQHMADLIAGKAIG